MAENTRYASIEGQPKVIAAYMPGNYKVTGYVETEGTILTFIEGEDRFGWTLDDYVRPRLESGLYFGLTELLEDPFKTEGLAVIPWTDKWED
jgi:hypothetical protein